MCMHTCVTHTCTNLHVSVHTRIRTSTYIHIRAARCPSMHIHIDLCARAERCQPLCTHTEVTAHMHAHMCKHTHVLPAHVHTPRLPVRVHADTHPSPPEHQRMRVEPHTCAHMILASSQVCGGLCSPTCQHTRVQKPSSVPAPTCTASLPRRGTHIASTCAATHTAAPTPLPPKSWGPLLCAHTPPVMQPPPSIRVPSMPFQLPAAPPHTPAAPHPGVTIRWASRTQDHGEILGGWGGPL